MATIAAGVVVPSNATEETAMHPTIDHDLAQAQIAHPLTWNRRAIHDHKAPPLVRALKAPGPGALHPVSTRGRGRSHPRWRSS